MKGIKFIWSNEDAVFILGGLVSLFQINFDISNSLFPLAVGMILKGVMSLFSITLGNDASEDVMLLIGAFSTLVSIHFSNSNPLFFVTLGAIIKAGFGIFGVNVDATGSTVTTDVPPTPAVKAPMWFLGFLLAGLMISQSASAQTVLAYEGGMNFNRQTLAGPVDGVFLEPLAQFSYEPLQLNNGQVSLGTSFTINFAYAIAFGTASPDVTKPGIDISPTVIVDVFGGNGFLSRIDNSAIVNQGVIGAGIGIPKLTGDLMPSVAVAVNSGSVFIGCAFVQSFDILNGLGVVKL